MKTLNIYVTKYFILVLLVSILVVTFGIMGAHAIKIFEFIARGIPFVDAMLALLYYMPFALSLAIPVGVFVSTMLVFGRMSADNEITAMRACGISVLQIISPLIILTFLLTCFCLLLQLEIGPYFAGKGRNLEKKVVVSNPLSIIEPGQYLQKTINGEETSLYVGDRVGEEGIKDIQIFQFSNNVNNEKYLKKDITAASGKISVDESKQHLIIDLFDASVVEYSEDKKRPRRTFSERFQLAYDYGRAFNEKKIGKRTKFLQLDELFGKTIMLKIIQSKLAGEVDKRLLRKITSLEIELNTRIAFGLAPIAFLLLGMPLAIRTSRRETSIGLLLGVILAGVYFISIMIFQAFSTYPHLYPQILLWIPNVIYQVGGAFFIWKIAKR